MIKKLKSDKIIESIFKDGKSVFRYPIKLVYIKINSDLNAKTYSGVSVSKRNFKKAVDRNRIKRQLRESVRLNEAFIKQDIGAYWAMMFIYVSKEKLDFNVINTSVVNVIKKIK